MKSHLQIGGEDTNITFEDQQQINTFARKSARIQELKDEIEEKKVKKSEKYLLVAKIPLSRLHLKKYA